MPPSAHRSCKAWALQEQGVAESGDQQRAPAEGASGSSPFVEWRSRALSPTMTSAFRCGAEPLRQGGGVGMSTTRVILAEDHALMRDAVRLVFDEAQDVDLVGDG